MAVCRPVAPGGGWRRGSRDPAGERPGAGRRQPRQPLGPGDGRDLGAQAPPDPGAGQIRPLGRARPGAGAQRHGPDPDRARSGDAGALARAVEALRRGSCIGVFPEGTRSRGKVLRARSGVGRLALEVPEAHVVCVAIEGTSDLTGFPRRPHCGSASSSRAAASPPDEDPGELSARLLAEIRALVPPIDLRPQARLGLVAVPSRRWGVAGTRWRRRRCCRCRWLRPASCPRRRCRAGGRRRSPGRCRLCVSVVPSFEAIAPSPAAVRLR